jgi:CHASE2 domain-containing sensor protein
MVRLNLIWMYPFVWIAFTPMFSQFIHDDIVLINVGKYDKVSIAKEIETLVKFEPKVLAIDVAFPTYRGDKTDKCLALALKKSRTLVLPSSIRVSGRDYYDNEIISVFLTSAPEFLPPGVQSGFVSSKTDSDIYLPDKFAILQKSYTGDNYYHFSVVAAMLFDSVATTNFIKKHSDSTNIRYNNRRHLFKKFSASQVLGGSVKQEDIKDKIVILGFLGPGEADRFITRQDNNASPVYIYGVEYLANLTAQILHQE